MISSDAAMLPADRLRDKLITMSGKGFQVYGELAGAYRFDGFVLYLDAIQPDPAAAPTRARVRVDHAEAQIPPELWETPARRTGILDYLGRAMREAIRRHAPARWSGRLPPLAIDSSGQAILQRASLKILEHEIEAQLAIGLPADGRKVLGKAAQSLFFEGLPAVVAAGLTWPQLDAQAARRHVDAVEDHAALQAALDPLGLVAFVADGAVLPRDQGPGDGPMHGARAVPFRAPEELAVTVMLPHRGAVRGLGIRRGVTVVAGAPFGGKSTLLAALARAVYAHAPGDGRELTATLPDAVAIRAEPGRRIERVDVSGFIGELPQRGDVSGLFMEHATGVASMAAGIAEAIEAGTRLLLIDEDDAAVAFLAREAVMRQLHPSGREPLTPLVDRVRALWGAHGISTIIATGALGDYLAVADTVLVMDGFQPTAATDRARALLAARPVSPPSEGQMALPAARYPQPRGLGGLRGRRLRTELRGRSALGIGRDTVELSALVQLVDPSQARAAGDAILYAIERGYVDGNASIVEIIDRVLTDIAQGGLGVLAVVESQGGDHALPRRHEIAAVLNRLRSLQVRQRYTAVSAEHPAAPQPPINAVEGRQEETPN